MENLSLLAAGKCDRRAVQALSREDLGAVFERFKAHFDFVVVDVCPVLPVPDALLIGQHADAALFAVLRNVSRLPAVFAAQQRLSSVDIPMLGAVVVGEAIETYGIDRYVALASAEDKEMNRRERRRSDNEECRLLPPAGRTGGGAGCGLGPRHVDAALEQIAGPGRGSRPIGSSAGGGGQLAGRGGRRGPRGHDRRGREGWWVRRFTNRRTGARVEVLLLCGNSGRMCVHRPETCYGGAGYQLAFPPVRYSLPSAGPAAEFWTARFTKEELSGPVNL